MHNYLKLWAMGISLALSVVLAKYLISDSFHPIYVALLQSIGSVLFLSIFGLQGLFAYLRQHFSYYVFASLLGFTVPQLLVFHTVEHVGASVISLTYAFPLLITYLLSVTLFEERLMIKSVLFLLVAFLGTVLFLFKADFVEMEKSNYTWGSAILLIPIVISMANIYRGRFWPQGVSVYMVALLTNLFSFVSYGIFAAVQMPDLPNADYLGGEHILAIAMLMVLASVGQYLLFSLHTSSSAVFIGQTGSITTFFGGIFGFVFFGESYQVSTLIGSVLILVGVSKFSQYQSESRKFV